MELKDLGGHQTWLGPIQAAYHTLPWSTPQHHSQVSAQNGNSWFAGEQNGIYAVWAIRTWEGMNLKALYLPV